MTRSLQKIGNSKGIILDRTMLDHLGATSAVDIQMEQGRIIITAAHPGRRQSFDEAKASTFAQYDDAFRRLADAG